MSHATKLDFFATAIALTATIIAVTASSNWQTTGSIEPSFEIANLESQPQSTTLPTSAPSFWSVLKSIELPKSISSDNQPLIRQAAVYAWIKPALADSAPKSLTSELSDTAPAELNETLAYLNQLKTCTPSEAQHMSVERQILGWQGNQCTVEARFAAIAHDGAIIHQTRTCQFNQAEINQLTATEVVNTLQAGEMTGLYELSQRLKSITDSSCMTTDAQF
ncbi:MAG: hypothetical protein ACTS2F_04555 [Thainema sp.]